ncbi:L,D-transpeptidase family protein [Sandaracinus amylolyticus]|uniref:L,D-transpeptidase family protein n=1 Tax=Sandaracinus amylolyticus TaxID=927083 RepID=UPI001F0044AE|nr:L,D-transpeptidase family protein [Sandaracinus amylolyticus]
MRRASMCAVAIGVAFVALARAQSTPLAIPARSLEVVASGVTIRAAPSTRAARRGTVRVGTRLPIEARVHGEGCPGGDWYRVSDDAFVCSSLVRPSAEIPGGEEVPVVAPGSLLPRAYAFVGVDGTWAYSRPSDYFLDDWTESLGRGFGIAITEVQSYEGVTFVRSLGGLWVPDDQLRRARGSDFEGVELQGALDVAWVARAGAIVRAWDGRRAGREVRRAGRRERVRVIEELPRGLVRIDDGVIASRDLQRPRAATPPDGLGELERWIDVDVATQTLVLYEGVRPLFATLVSTGRPGPGSDTPTGTFRIWVKLAEDTMDDLERTDQESNYAIEAVPWVQYFAEGVGLHAAFWHDDFGRRRSHGCVNLAPRDARRLFGITEPALPPGWDAILPTTARPGTLVRVRD